MDVVVPTLRSGTAQLITDPGAVVAYLIGFMFTNPGETSTTFPELISFRTLEAHHGKDRETLAENMSSVLQRVISDIYPTSGISVSVTSEVVTETTYKLIITIIDGSGAPLIPLKIIKIDDEQIKILT